MNVSYLELIWHPQSPDARHATPSSGRSTRLLRGTALIAVPPSAFCRFPLAPAPLTAPDYSRGADRIQDMFGTDDMMLAFSSMLRAQSDEDTEIANTNAAPVEDGIGLAPERRKARS